MTSLLNKLNTTEDIKEDCEYITSIGTFFQPAWKSVVSQVLKLETRQVYIEDDNPSYQLLVQGRFDDAVALLSSVRKSDVNLYKDLISRKVDFIRCRPVILPLTEYLRWEIEAYKFNAQYAEKIFFSNYSITANIFEKYALHDFMVFDSTEAIIMDYDCDGKLQGGWVVTDENKITCLIHLYAEIRAKSIEFTKFLETM